MPLSISDEGRSGRRDESRGPGGGQNRGATRPDATVLTIPGSVHLYPDPSSPTLDVDSVAAFLRDLLGLRCGVRDEFFAQFSGGDLEGLATKIAATKVRNLARPFEPAEPQFGEIQFERRLVGDPSKRVPGILYDAFEYEARLKDLLPASERTLRRIHIVFTHRLLGSFGEDGRYHARSVVCGYPSVVSTSGIVEGPAKAEAYYRIKAQLTTALGAVPFEAAKEPFAGRFIDYDDPRLTEVAKGYALQCVMYHIAGDAFCEDVTCRLFNAHWQSELIAAQIESGRLCARHADLARRIRDAGRPARRATRDSPRRTPR